MIPDRCHCSHDKASHYRDHTTSAIGSCLCRGCECTTYVHFLDAKPVAEKKAKLDAFLYYEWDAHCDLVTQEFLAVPQAFDPLFGEIQPLFSDDAETLPRIAVAVDVHEAETVRSIVAAQWCGEEL